MTPKSLYKLLHIVGKHQVGLPKVFALTHDPYLPHNNRQFLLFVYQLLARHKT